MVMSYYFKKGEQVFIGYIDEQPVAMLRFTLSGKTICECKVRMSVPRNIESYHSLGYSVTKESKEKNRNGCSLSVATMEKQLTN
ncbi:hypothetical protein ACIQGW_08685 [Lysinibacillus xylanilyticus]